MRCTLCMGDEYSLTPLGREFIEPMEMLYE
jgi:DNA-binding HxlR family transcriptional regulator